MTMKNTGRMPRRLRIRLVRDDFNALDLLSLEGIKAPRSKRIRLRAWRRLGKRPPKRRLGALALLPLLGRRFRNRAKDSANPPPRRPLH